MAPPSLVVTFERPKPVAIRCEAVAPVLFRDTSAFAVDHVVAVEPGGDELLFGRFRQQVARQLLDGELIERHVAVEGLDHPVAIGPNLAVVVEVQTVGVAVAGGIEPEPGHVLTVAGRLEQPVHQPLVGARLFVGQELADLAERGRQTGQVERDPADERAAVGLGRRGQAGLFEPRPHKEINRPDRPVGVLDLGQRRPLGRPKRPVLGKFGPLLDPAANQLDLGLGERFAVGVGRRHPLVGIFGKDPPQEFALVGVIGNDGPQARIGLGRGAVSQIEANASLAGRVVGPVALVAAVRQQRADIAIVVDLWGFRLGRSLLGPSVQGQCGETEQQRQHHAVTCAAGHRANTGAGIYHERSRLNQGSRENSKVEGPRPSTQNLVRQVPQAAA